MNSSEHTPVVLQSLDELIEALSEGERTTYDKIIRSVELSKDDFKDFCSWSTDSYSRNCIVDNEKFELILLCWEEGQATPIHDHGGEECWVKVIEGEFKETIFTEDEDGELNKVKSAFAKSDDITYMIDFMGFHSLENVSDKRSMSLHLYAKPIRSCNVFDEDSNTFVNKDLVYDNIA